MISKGDGEWGEWIELTLILELWGTAGCPFTAGTTVSQTPKSFLTILLAFLSQLSIKQDKQMPKRGEFSAKPTELSNERCIDGIWSPFTISNIAVRKDIDSEILVSLINKEDISI
jgi:hypothetical protein